MKQTQGRIEYRCSFCGKPQVAVHRLIAGPNGVYICNECVALCQEIIAEEQAGSARPASPDTGGEALSPSSEPGESGDSAQALTPAARDVDAAPHAQLAPLVAELAAARATIERLARENGALRERLGTP